MSLDILEFFAARQSAIIFPFSCSSYIPTAARKRGAISTAAREAIAMEKWGNRYDGSQCAVVPFGVSAHNLHARRSEAHVMRARKPLRAPYRTSGARVEKNRAAAQAVGLVWVLLCCTYRLICCATRALQTA
jgi:hypothetical protein